MTDGTPFTDRDMSRRDFVRLSTITGGALALPGGATASVDSAKFDAEYEYVLNHTPEEYEVPTLVTFADAAGFHALEVVGDGEIRTTTTPRPAAYTTLTKAQAQEVVEIPTAEELSHSPGANPFWRIGYYPLGVFPDPQRCTDFIDYEEMIAGMEHLESRHTDRMNFYSIGKSPGHYNVLTDREDPKDIYVVEVTNDIDDAETYEEKTKVMYTLSIHGSERPGAEAGSRFIENLLDGRETEIEALLDDLVLIFIYQNPDGWVAKHPQYETTAGLPGVPLYQRGNAEVGDTNRQYPISGWIDPIHYPAEPDGRNLVDDQPGIDVDVPDAIREHVPDALALVEHFRDYENLDYGVDLHSMAISDEFVLGLINQDQYDHRQLHELYEMNRVVDETLEAELQTWNTLADAQQTVTGDTNPEWASGFGTLPEEAFDYSTIYDTLGYTTSGDYISWLANPEELGGLDMTTMAFEVVSAAGAAYNPELVDMQVRGYVTSIRTVSKYAVQNSDTLHSDDEFSASVETDGLSTAYVTTDELTRSSDDLEFVSESDDGGDSGLLAQTTRTGESVAVPAGGTETVTTVPEDAHTLSVRIQPRMDTFVRARLIDPDGDVVASFDPSAQDRYGGMEPWVVRDAAAGTWQIELENLRESGGQVTVRTATLQAETETPDPVEALGYDQRDYKVSPFVFFDANYVPDDDPLRATSIERDYDDVTDAAVDALTPADVAAGEHLSYDNLVVIHDDGSDDADYLAGLEEFVDTGGNLVLTDTGVHQLGRLDTSLTTEISTDDVETVDPFYVGHLAEKFSDHPLLEDTRPIQQMLWKIAPLGYSIPSEGASAGEAPMTLVDRGAFETAGGRVAGLTDDRVAAGTLAPPEASGTIRDLVESEQGSVQVISGLLPPAKQTNLHPFGMQDYAVSFFGHTIFVNALGHVQHRFVGGDRVKTFGGEGQFESSEVPSDGVAASGSRDAGDTVQIGGDTVRVSVELSHEADEALRVRDFIPYSYEVIETGGTVEDIEKRRGDGVQILTIGPDADPGETLQFDYLVRTAESVGTQRRSGSYDLGPAQVYDPDEETWVDVDGTTETHVVVAAEPLQEA